MNVVIVTYVYPPEHAPWGVMVRELAEDLARLGHRVTVLTGWPSHPRGALYSGWRARFREVHRDPAGFAVVRCGHSFGPRGRMLPRLCHHLSFAISSFLNGLTAGAVDVVVGGSTPLFGCWSAWLLSRLKGARYVYYVADLWPESTRTAGLLREGPLYRLMRKTDSLLCRLSEAISTLSLALRRAVEERGIPARKVEVIPFWLDPDKVRPQDRDNPWRRAQGIGPGQFVALYAGTIGFISGAGILVDVARRLRDRPDVVLLVVGEGPVKEDLQARAREANLTNLRFLPFQPAEDLSPMQASADVGLITLLPEAGENSVPSKMLGYLAAGRAVIASVARDSPTAEAVVEGQCGRVVAPQQAEALAEAIRQAADDRPWVRAAGLSARRYFLDNYSRSTITRRWEVLLRRLA